MKAFDRHNAQWRKSSASAMGNCVEVARQGELVGVRDSKNPEGAVLVVYAAAFGEFVSALRAGGSGRF